MTNEVTLLVESNGNPVKDEQFSHAFANVVAAVVLKLGNVPVRLLQLRKALDQLVTADVSGRFVLGMLCSLLQP